MTPFLNSDEVRRMAELLDKGKTWDQAFAVILKERKKPQRK